MNKFNIVFLMLFLVSCNFYNTQSVNTFDDLFAYREEREESRPVYRDPIKQALSLKYRHNYAYILDNMEFIGETFYKNGIELNILYAFGNWGSNSYIFDELVGDWIECTEKAFVWANSHVLFTITDTLGRIDFGNENFVFQFGENSPSTSPSNLFGESPLHYDNGIAYFVATRSGHYRFDVYLGEENTLDIEELYIEFSLDSIMSDFHSTREDIDINIAQILENHSATRTESPISGIISQAPHLFVINSGMPDLSAYNTNFLSFDELDIYLKEDHYLLNVALTEVEDGHLLEILTRSPIGEVSRPRRVELSLETASPLSMWNHLFTIRYTDESDPNNTMQYVQNIYRVNDVSRLSDYKLYFRISHYRDLIEVDLEAGFYANVLMLE